MSKIRKTKLNLTARRKSLGFNKTSLKIYHELRKKGIKITQKEFLETRNISIKFNRTIAQPSVQERIGEKIPQISINFSKLRTQAEWNKRKKYIEYKASGEIVEKIEKSIRYNLSINLKRLGLEKYEEFFNDLTSTELNEFFNKKNRDIQYLNQYIKNEQTLNDVASLTGLTEAKLVNRINDWVKKKNQDKGKAEKAKNARKTKNNKRKKPR